MRARRAETAEGGSLPGAGSARLGTVVSCLTARAARPGAQRRDTPKQQCQVPGAQDRDGRGGEDLTDADAHAEPPRREAGPFLTPYEMAFGEAGFETRIFPRIQAEADAHGEDPTLRERFG